MSTDFTHNIQTTAIQINADTQAPKLTSIKRQTPASAITNADSLTFAVKFNEEVKDVDPDHFVVTGAAVDLVAVVPVVPQGSLGNSVITEYLITVGGGNLATFEGTVGLNLAANQNITDLAGNALLPGEPTTDEVFTLDNTTPIFSSIKRKTPSSATTDANSLTFELKFNEAVQNVNTSDFVVTGAQPNLIVFEQVDSLTYNMTLAGGNLANLNGPVGVNLAANQDITDLAGNALPTAEPGIDETYQVTNAPEVIVIDFEKVTSPEPRDLVFTFEQFVEFSAIADEDGPLFDEDLYLLANPDVQAAVGQGVHANGLEHYNEYGKAEGRDLLPLDMEIGGIKLSAIFDEAQYLSQYKDVAAAVSAGRFAYGFEHFIRFGLMEGRNPSTFFNEKAYLEKYADVKAAVDKGTFSSGLMHYLQAGHQENRVASELFDPEDYLVNNRDVRNAIEKGRFSSAFEHFAEAGASEGRVAALLFEEAFYLSDNPDVAKAIQAGKFESGFEHFVSFGQKEGRSPNALFEEDAYLNSNPDVARAVGRGLIASGFEHFAQFGRAEDRAIA